MFIREIGVPLHFTIKHNIMYFVKFLDSKINVTRTLCTDQISRVDKEGNLVVVMVNGGVVIFPVAELISIFTLNNIN